MTEENKKVGRDLEKQRSRPEQEETRKVRNLVDKVKETTEKQIKNRRSR